MPFRPVLPLTHEATPFRWWCKTSGYWWCVKLLYIHAIRLLRVLVGWDQVTGDYGTPPLFSVYRTQLLAYTVILVICKAVTTVIVIAMDEVLSSLAKALFAPVSAYPELELTLVMIICPW